MLRPVGYGPETKPPHVSFPSHATNFKTEKIFQLGFVFLNFNMASTSEMTFEEKFEAFMKNYQAVPSSKAELEKQNEYLQKLLEDDMKQKQKALESPSASIHNEDEASNLNSSSSDEEPQRRVRGARRTS